MKNISIREYSFCFFNNNTNKALLFVQYPYLFNNEVVGKCIYLQNPMCNFLNIKKNILNEDFYTLKEYYKDKKLVINSDEKMNLIFQNAMPDCIHKSQKKTLFMTNLSVLNRKYLIKVFDPITEKENLIRDNNSLKNIVMEISDLFDISSNQIGFTGSILFSNLAKINDYDVVLYVNITKSKEIRKIILEKKKEKPVSPQYNIDWPLRYYDSNNNLICLFFSYEETEFSPLLAYNEFRPLRNISFDSFVLEDNHSEFAPTILTLDEPYYDLIILGTACRGFFEKGHKIKGEGTLIQGIYKNRNDFFILITNPWKQLFSRPFSY